MGVRGYELDVREFICFFFLLVLGRAFMRGFSFRFLFILFGVC